MSIGKMYIDGKWVESVSKKTKDIINPANGSVIATVTEGTREDTRAAIAAAKRAFYVDGWGKTSSMERAAILNKIADLLEARAEELGKLESQNHGKTMVVSSDDMMICTCTFRYYAGLIGKPTGQTYEVPDPNTQTIVVREPMGVCGLIAPWNFPLNMAVTKIAPCLAAGNTLIMKPAEITPLSTIELFKIMEEAGLPAGVANLVLGKGSEVGDELAANVDVDKVSFTGGTSTGRAIAKAATSNMKNLTLELGGKSPIIVYDDADIEAAVDWTMVGIFFNQGEVCTASSRLILQDTIYDKFLDRLVERTKKLKIGPGDQEGIDMGPIVSEAHMNEILRYIEIGKAEGARLLCGGERLTEGELAKGFFVAPTIFADCTPDMTIVKEEIFGPVLAVQKFHTDEEAIALANDTVYGLAGAVFSENLSRAISTIKAVRAGITWINSNCATFGESPWHGYKQSGVGCSGGTFGMEDYMEVKQININLATGPSGIFPM